MRATWIQNNFNAGEWSPLAHGRFDIAKYKNGLAECLNFKPTQQGGLTKREGTRFVAHVKNSSYAPRLIRFEFSVEQAYILEFGAGYIRIFANDSVYYGPIADTPTYDGTVTYALGDVVHRIGLIPWRSLQAGNVGHVPESSPTWWEPVEIVTLGGPPSYLIDVVTPYSINEVWQLNFTQSADTLYIAHSNHPPMKFQRHAAGYWTLTAVSFLDGPYLPTNITTTTLTAFGTSGAVIVTSSAPVFNTADVGRLLRVKVSGTWLWGTVTAFTNASMVTWTISPATGSQVPVTAQARANVSGGSVFTCSVLDGGGGYGTQPPTVTFTPQATVAATAHIVVDGTGIITSVVVDSGGSGYASDPTISVTSSGTGALLYAHVSGGAVVAIYVGAGGSGYSGGDTVNILGGGSGGSGAVGYATVTNGVVTSITMSSTGTGYTIAPAVTLSAPVGSVPMATTFWRKGEWCSDFAYLYPSCVTFHQDRLCFSGNLQFPGRIDCSNSGDYENFAPSNQDGTIVDSNALAFTLNAGTVNAIRWLVSDENGLLVGTASGEWIISPSSTQQALTPTNVNAKPLGNYGSAAVPPIRVGKATLFIQRTGRKLRELFYQFTVNTFQSPDISLVSEHLTKSGIKQMALQLAPQQIVWMGRNDSQLVGMTYDRDQEVCGWHGHKLGGFSDAVQTIPSLVESVAGIPAPSTQRDEVWMVVNRYINGAVSRTIEVFAKPWEDGDAIQNAVYLDSSANYIGAPTTTISGLTWLKGQTVGVLGDGLVYPDCVVDNAGSISFARPARTVQVGLKYVARGKTLRIEAGGADGPSQGKTRRIIRVVFRFFQTLGLELMSSAPGVGFFPQPFRDSTDPMDQQVPLFDGDKRWPYDGTWELDGQVYFLSSDALPCNITLLMAQIDTQDNQ